MGRKKDLEKENRQLKEMIRQLMNQKGMSVDEVLGIDDDDGIVVKSNEVPPTEKIDTSHQHRAAANMQEIPSLTGTVIQDDDGKWHYPPGYNQAEEDFVRKAYGKDYMKVREMNMLYDRIQEGYGYGGMLSSIFNFAKAVKGINAINSGIVGEDLEPAEEYAAREKRRRIRENRREKMKELVEDTFGIPGWQFDESGSGMFGGLRLNLLAALATDPDKVQESMEGFFANPYMAKEILKSACY